MGGEGLRVVVGLGNPGERYEGTRHNVGFLVADLLLAEADPGASWRRSPAGEGLVASAAGLLLAKPQTSMNLSGGFVAALARFHKIEPSRVLVVSDDIDLPLGRVRIRKSGSSGGQRGLESVLEALGTREVPRLRLGVGPRPERVDAADFVLGRFGAGERDAVLRMVRRGAEAARAAVERGIEAAMNEYNPAEPGEGAP